VCGNRTISETLSLMDTKEGTNGVRVGCLLGERNGVEFIREIGSSYEPDLQSCTPKVWLDHIRENVPWKSLKKTSPKRSG